MRKAADAAGVPLAPMIDITFQLILFFILTAAMQKEKVDFNIKLAKVKFLSPVELNKNTITINLRYISETLPPVLSIAGQARTLDQIEMDLRKAQAKYGSQVPVRIRADGKLKWREIEKINERVGRAGLSQVLHSAEMAEAKKGAAN